MNEQTNGPAGTGSRLIALLAARPLYLYLALAIPLWLFFSWASFNMQASLVIFHNDFWEHSAALNAWLNDFSNPGDPHLPTDNGSARYMPFYAVVTLIAGTLRLDALGAMGLAGFLSISLFVIATPLFANRYFRDPRAGTVAIIVLLCGWGFGVIFSNLHQMRGLLHVIGFPSFFVFSLTFLLLWLALGILRSDRPNYLVLPVLTLLVAIAYASHPLTGAFAIGSLLLLALMEPQVHFIHRVYLAVAVGIGAVLVELWPYFSTWDIVLGVNKTTDISDNIKTPGSWIERSEVVKGFSRPVSLALEHPFYRISDVLSALGPAFFGIPVIVYFLATRRQLYIAVGALLMLVPYLLNVIFPIPLGHRFLLFFIFFLHLALIWLLLYIMGNDEGQRRPTDRRCRHIATGFLGFILLWNIGLTIAEIIKTSLIRHELISSRNHTVANIVPLMNDIAGRIPDDAVVMAPLYLGWPLPTFGGKLVGTMHQNPLNPGDRERRGNVYRFFSPTTTNSERMMLLDLYDVTHILYDARQVKPETVAQLGEIPGQPITVGNYVIIEFNLDNQKPVSPE